MNSDFTVTPKFATKMLEKALRLYTPSLSERPMAEFLADKCDDLGFEDIQIDEVGNIIAKKGSGSPKIMLCGHMDVVPGKVKVRKEGDALYGRGASDAKAPLMAMLFAAASIEKNQGTVTFVGAVDEEGNAVGIKNIVKKKMDIDCISAFNPERHLESQTSRSQQGRLETAGKTKGGPWALDDPPSRQTSRHTIRRHSQITRLLSQRGVAICFWMNERETVKK